MVESPSGSGAERPERAQLVLAAAALIALALVPVAVAYVQLGYHPDVTASTDYDGHGANAERFLGRAIHEAGANATGRPWGERDRAVDAVREDLAPRLDTLEASQATEGVAYTTRYNRSAADGWAAANCPGGSGRRFGPCVADRGVVVQERAGEAVVLAVALDVEVTTPRGGRDLTFVVRVVE